MIKMAQNSSSCVVSRSPEIPIGIIHKDIIYTIDVWSKTHTPTMEGFRLMLLA